MPSRSYLFLTWWLPWTAGSDSPLTPICLHRGGTSPQRPEGSVADSYLQAPSPDPPAPQLRPLPLQWAVVESGSTFGSPHPGPQRCPGACRSHCSPPEHKPFPHGRQERSTHGTETWTGTSPNTVTSLDSQPFPVQACLSDQETMSHTTLLWGCKDSEWDGRGKEIQETSRGSSLFLQICVGCERVHPVGVKTRRMSKSPECQTVQRYEKSVSFIHVWWFQAATSASVLCQFPYRENFLVKIADSVYSRV